MGTKHIQNRPEMFGTAPAKLDFAAHSIGHLDPKVEGSSPFGLVNVKLCRLKVYRIFVFSGFSQKQAVI